MEYMSFGWHICKMIIESIRIANSRFHLIINFELWQIVVCSNIEMTVCWVGDFRQLMVYLLLIRAVGTMLLK